MESKHFDKLRLDLIHNLNDNATNDLAKEIVESYTTKVEDKTIDNLD